MFIAAAIAAGFQTFRPPGYGGPNCLFNISRKEPKSAPWKWGDPFPAKMTPEQKRLFWAFLKANGSAAVYPGDPWLNLGQ
jgi:hypothetical protein